MCMTPLFEAWSFYSIRLQQNPYVVTVLRDTRRQKYLKVNEEEKQTLYHSCEILKGSPYVSEPTRELISNLYLSNNNNDTSAISLAP